MPFVVTSEKQADLAHDISQKLKLPLLQAKTIRFADSEMRVHFDDAHFDDTHLDDEQNMAKDHAIIVHSTSFPVHDNVMWLLLCCHALKQKGVKFITAVIPYFGYGRQDKNADGSLGAAHLVAQVLEAAGVSQIITVELHEPEIINYFSIPVRNINLSGFIANFLKDKCGDGACTLISPDHGAADWASAIAAQIDAPTMIFQKERYAVNQTRIVASKGTCETKHAVIVDDIVDTGSTIINVAQELQQMHSACAISAFAVHPVLSANAADCLQGSVFHKVWVTNTIQLNAEQHFQKLEIVDVSMEIVNVLKGIL